MFPPRAEESRDVISGIDITWSSGPTGARAGCMAVMTIYARVWSVAWSADDLPDLVACEASLNQQCISHPLDRVPVFADHVPASFTDAGIV